jgi:hypothetical protein
MSRPQPRKSERERELLGFPLLDMARHWVKVGDETSYRYAFGFDGTCFTVMSKNRSISESKELLGESMRERGHAEIVLGE